VKSVITNGWRSPVNLSLRNKEEYFSIVTYYGSFHPQLPAGIPKSITAAFIIDFSASLAIQNL